MSSHFMYVFSAYLFSFLAPMILGLKNYLTFHSYKKKNINNNF